MLVGPRAAGGPAYRVCMTVSRRLGIMAAEESNRPGHEPGIAPVERMGRKAPLGENARLRRVADDAFGRFSAEPRAHGHTSKTIAERVVNALVCP